MSNLICAAIHLCVCISFIHIAFMAQTVADAVADAIKSTTVSKMLIEKFPTLALYSEHRTANTPPIKTSWKLNQRRKKICFSILLYFIAFFCCELSLGALSGSSCDCFVVDVDVGSGVVMLIQMKRRTATYRMAIHPSRVSAGAICHLSPSLSLLLSFHSRAPHSSSGVGVLWRNKNRKNQKRDWINGMFALIICSNIGPKSTEKPNAPFEWMSECVCRRVNRMFVLNIDVMCVSCESVYCK